MKRKNSRKKKGFTLVELIAVIAILGVLAAIIVPRVGDFTGKATDVQVLTNARNILSAVELYNADHTNNTDEMIKDSDKLSEIDDKLVPKYLDQWPKKLKVTASGTDANENSTLADLRAYVNAKTNK